MPEYTPQTTDLQSGIIICQNCRRKIPLNFCEPLEVLPCPECETPFFMPLKIKSYWLYRPLGGGGMGSVYKALSETEPGEFAVKILPRSRKDSQSLIKTLLKEGEVGQILGKSPYIIEVTDYGCDAGEYFMASRFVKGTRLDIFVSSAGKLSERQALDIILPLTDAEIHIKNCGYLFRDMKPENVMIAEESASVKLFDFGLCMPIEQAANPNPEDKLEGSPYYLPPERIVAAPEGEYSEIYSLGMLLFYMLSGTTYFSQADVKDLVTKHVRSLRVATVTSRLKHCSPEIIAVIDKMIQRDPNERFHNFDEVRERLAALVEKAPGYPLAPEKQTNKTTQTSTGTTGKNGIIRTAAVILTTGIIAAVFFGWQHIKTLKHEKLLRQTTEKTAAELSIPSNVKAPSLSIQEIEKLIHAETEKQLRGKKKEMPDFNRQETLKSICNNLHIDFATFRKPAISPYELKQYERKELNTRIEKAMQAAAGEFNEAAVKKQLAKSMNITIPIPKPKKLLNEIKKEADDKSRRIADEKYPSKKLSLDINNILKKYKCCKIGDRVTVPTNAGGDIIGMYQGQSGRMILIDGKEIMLKDLPPDFALKFNEALSAKKAGDEIRKTRALFNTAKKKSRENAYRSILADICRKDGYRRNSGGQWIPASELLSILLEKNRKEFEKEKLNREETIIKTVRATFDKDSFYRKYGYCIQNNKLSSLYSIAQAQLTKKEKQFYTERMEELKKLERSIRNEIELKLFEANGYVFRDGRWQSARALLDAAVKKKMKQAEQ